MLERLCVAGETPVTLPSCAAARLNFPTAVMGELELNGYASNYRCSPNAFWESVLKARVLSSMRLVRL